MTDQTSIQQVRFGELRTCHACNIQAHYFASDAYSYMLCARKLYLDSKRGFRLITPKLSEIFLKGKEEHERVGALLKQKYKLIQFEVPFTKQIGKYTMHGHADAVVRDWIGSYNSNIIEIKPRYNLGGYMQTLMYKLLSNYQIYLTEYNNGLNIFPLKADLQMAKVYFARLVTASKILAPRLPKYPDAFMCIQCDQLNECMNRIDYKWNDKDNREYHQPFVSHETFRQLADKTYSEIFD